MPEALAQAGIPALQVLRRVEGDGARFPFAAPDYAEGSRLAVAHLRALGARRLAFVGGIAGNFLGRAGEDANVRRAEDRGAIDPLLGQGDLRLAVLGRSAIRNADFRQSPIKNKSLCKRRVDRCR